MLIIRSIDQHHFSSVWSEQKANSGLTIDDDPSVHGSAHCMDIFGSCFQE